MELQEMKNLSHLARIEMSDTELASMAHEFEGILEYVAQINNVEIDISNTQHLQANVTRDDKPREVDFDGSTLLSGAPDTQDGFYKVPKILN